MSLLTRCPACQTLYKLVPDQLRISQGWVKCGQCGEIFDASKHLIQVAVEPTTVVAPQLSLASAQIASDLQSMQAEPADDAQLSQPADGPIDEIKPVTDGVVGAEIALNQPVASEPSPAAEDALDEVSPAALDQSVLCDVGVPQAEPQLTASVSENLTDAAPAPMPRLLPEPEPEFLKVSFMGAAQRQSVWRTRAGNLFLWLAAFLLAASLLLQGLFWERDHLASIYPDLKPLLQQMCLPLHCTVSALQRVDAMVIDSAAFNRLNADSYQLSFVIKNLSKLVLALPSIELTLTDMQEQVIVRRVLPPHEMFTANQECLPGAELPVSLVLQLDLGEATPRPMGYRLLAFYP